VLQGAGAAFLVTGALALVASAFPGAGQRARAFGVLGVISGVAMAMGPTLGSFLASWFGWRWIFLANIPFCAALALAVPRLVAETRDPKGRPLDPIGVALLAASLGLAIDTLLRHDASLVTRAACLVASVMGAILFGWRQWRSPHPLLDPRVFATSAMAGVGALLTAIQFGYWAVLVYLPLFLNIGLGMSIEFAGLALLAATLPMLLVPPIGGRLATRHGWRLFFTIAFAVMLVGDASLAISALSETPSMRLVATAIGMLAIGIGAALANPQLSGVAIALAPPAQAGMAAAVMMIVRQGGFAISIAVLGAVLGTTSDAAAFAGPFTLAALAALLGIATALTLLPSKSTQRSTRC
jgi:MFS family permease